MSFVEKVRSQFSLFKAKASALEPADDREIADWSPECMAFLRYWTSLRKDAGVPTSEDFLDSPSTRFAPYVYILEILDGAPVVRLQGSQLEQAWARDLTGGDFFPGRSARFRAAAIANMRAVITHPCGHLARSTYATSKGLKITSDWIQLPLGVREGRAPRLMGDRPRRPRQWRLTGAACLRGRGHTDRALACGDGRPRLGICPLGDGSVGGPQRIGGCRAQHGRGRAAQ